MHEPRRLVTSWVAALGCAGSAIFERAVAAAARIDPSIRIALATPTLRYKAADVLGRDGMLSSVARLNERQQAFVIDAIIGREAVRILHGPPGTGKTSTIVALLDVLIAAAEIDPAAADVPRVLVCTPSNAAADLVVDRLFALLQRRGIDASRPLHRSGGGAVAAAPATGNGSSSCGIVARIHAQGRDLSDVSDAVRRCSPALRSGHDGVLRRPHVSALGLHAAHVVVATAVSAAQLHAAAVGTHHRFTHVIFDEAGQLTEPEAMTGLGVADPHFTRVLLAGDHRQLGAVVSNAAAKEIGLGMSPLERLASRHDCADCVTMLTDNYRSHPAILSLFNPTYGGRLKAFASASVEGSDSTAYWFDGGGGHRLFARQRVPVALLDVPNGVERREGPNSVSLCNPMEVRIVADVVAALIGYRPPNSTPHHRALTASDIAVITPYNAQGRALRRVLPRNVEVSSVEKFQGREAPVVIVSTVRSRRPANAAQERRWSIGFLRQPQRLNVTVSRPCAALVLVGNLGAICAYDNDDVAVAAAAAVDNDDITENDTRSNPAASSNGAGARDRLTALRDAFAADASFDTTKFMLPPAANSPAGSSPVQPFEDGGYVVPTWTGLVRSALELGAVADAHTLQPLTPADMFQRMVAAAGNG